MRAVHLDEQRDLAVVVAGSDRHDEEGRGQSRHPQGAVGDAADDAVDVVHFRRGGVEADADGEHEGANEGEHLVNLNVPLLGEALQGAPAPKVRDVSRRVDVLLELFREVGVELFPFVPLREGLEERLPLALLRPLLHSLEDYDDCEADEKADGHEPVHVVEVRDLVQVVAIAAAAAAAAADGHLHHLRGVSAAQPRRGGRRGIHRELSAFAFVFLGVLGLVLFVLGGGLSSYNLTPISGCVYTIYTSN